MLRRCSSHASEGGQGPRGAHGGLSRGWVPRGADGAPKARPSFGGASVWGAAACSMVFRARGTCEVSALRPADVQLSARLRRTTTRQGVGGLHSANAAYQVLEGPHVLRLRRFFLSQRKLLLVRLESRDRDGKNDKKSKKTAARG